MHGLTDCLKQASVKKLTGWQRSTMTSIRVRGVNRVTAKGRVYYYHRATGTRIKTDPSDAAAFATVVAALNAGTPSIEKGEKMPGTIGALLAAYRQSPKFLETKPDTKRGYMRAIDACKPIDGMPVAKLDQRFILAFQDRLYRKRGRWLANMVVKVLSVALGWATPRGIVSLNSAKGVPMIRRPRGEIANKAWTSREVDAALKMAHGGLRKAIALAYYGGLRKKDCVEVERTARARGQIDLLRARLAAS